MKPAVHKIFIVQNICTFLNKDGEAFSQSWEFFLDQTMKKMLINLYIAYTNLNRWKEKYVIADISTSRRYSGEVFYNQERFFLLKLWRKC
jgi:hypothetical protein